jgi:hypothetical protein
MLRDETEFKGSMRELCRGMGEGFRSLPVCNMSGGINRTNHILKNSANRPGEARIRSGFYSPFYLASADVRSYQDPDCHRRRQADSLAEVSLT